MIHIWSKWPRRYGGVKWMSCGGVGGGLGGRVMRVVVVVVVVVGGLWTTYPDLFVASLKNHPTAGDITAEIKKITVPQTIVRE